MPKYEIIVKVWDNYFVEIEANNREEAILMAYLTNVEEDGLNTDGGRDIEEMEEVEAFDDEEDEEEEEEDDEEN